jgi:hypothetical protein
MNLRLVTISLLAVFASSCSALHTPMDFIEYESFERPLTVPAPGPETRELQPGDIVGHTGHVGIIAMINGEPYYLESGGSVLPRNGNFPHKAGPALTIFARRGDVVVRRALP